MFYDNYHYATNTVMLSDPHTMCGGGFLSKLHISAAVAAATNDPKHQSLSDFSAQSAEFCVCVALFGSNTRNSATVRVCIVKIK